MKTYNIVKQPDGDVNLIRLEDGYTRVLKPSLLPYSALGRVYFGNGDNVALSEIVELNGSSDDLPTNINDMIVRLNDDFFTGDGGGSATTDASALTSGTLNDSRLSNNVVFTNKTQTITNKTLTSPVINNPTGIDKSDVGLYNVDNTSDADKPVSNAVLGALGNKADLVSGKVPASQLPGFVDDVLEYADLVSFPAMGEDGKIYVAEDVNKTYRWSGSGYVEIGGGGVAIGETASTAYRGDRGKTAYDHSQLTSGNPHNVSKNDVGLGSVDNTSDGNKPISTATQTALNLKANLASPTFTGTVVLPSTTSIGGVTNTQIGYLSGVTSAIQTQLNAKAALASPALTGTPTAPTATAGTNTTQLATTAFVLANQGSGGGDVTQTGAQSLSNKTLVAPKIANSDFISDTNGNELVKFSGITSAVNEITVGNALTGARPYIRATGGDANIDLELGGKGTGGIMNGAKWMAQSAYYYNVKEDGKTIAGPNAVGNGTTDDTNAFQFAIYAGQGVTNKVILVPPGTYLIKGTIYLSGSNITIKGSGIGKTIIKVDGAFSGSGSIFEGNGVSDIMFEDLTVTGNGKELAGAFKFNSYGDAYTQAKRFTLNRVQVVDFWGEGVLMGGSSVTPDTHNADLLSVTYCQFQRLYNPSQPIVYVDGVTKYDAIDLNQTTCRTWIVGNLIENCSGDGIYGYGQSQAVDNLDYGNWMIAFNQIKNCFMGIEINGNRLGRALKIDNNIIKFTNRIVGYCISVDSERATITNNTLYNVDRGLIEYTAVGGIITGNTGQIVPWSSTSGGVAPTSLSNAVSFMEIYGFENLVDDNIFSYPVGRTGAGANTPTEFRGIMLINTTTDPTDQPTSYDGISGNMAYINIKNNIISGFTHKGVDATVSRIKKVNLTNNTFRSRNSTQTVISIYGDSWNVIDNIIDMTGSTPNASNGAIGIFSSQSDNSNSIVKGNTIINAAWQILNTDRLIAFQNTFVSTSSPNVSYIINQAPTVTSAQRLALTPIEGMTVTQTDGGANAGTYAYTNGAWVKQ